MPAAAAASCTRGERHAGFDGDRRVRGIDRAHAVHAAQATARPRRRASSGIAPPHKPGVAALRDDRRAGLGAGAHDGGDFSVDAGARRRARRRGSGRANRRDRARCRPARVSTCAAPTMPARRASKVAPGSAIGEDSSKRRIPLRTARIGGRMPKTTEQPIRASRRAGGFPFSPQDALEFMQSMWNPLGIAMPGFAAPARRAPRRRRAMPRRCRFRIPPRCSRRSIPSRSTARSPSSGHRELAHDEPAT